MLRRPLLAAALAAVTALPALAQEAPWPSRPITIMGGFPNGAGTDIYARRLAEPLSRALGQPVVVDNRTGAGGNIASEYVAKQPADGYLFLFGTAGTHAINASLYRRLPFDVIRDFTPVVLLGDVPNVMIVSPEKRPNYRTCQDVIAAARVRPQAVTYASTGNGASTHLAGAQFAVATGLDLLHVPYRGQPGAMTSLLGGDTDVFFNQTGAAMGPIRQGQVRPLAVMTRERLAALPDVPTVAEACGTQPMDTSTWYALLAPAHLPEPILRRMNTEVNRIIATPEFRAWLIENQAITPPVAPNTPEQFRETMARDVARWAEVVRRSGATVD
ncbi:Bug family tripartite tricarboxylate transporter substrate binding protein [Neoroseomonas soli]|uniref:Tripartite tricarboxylate transporter substrate binding protein n=1 Tax=Neoroseomonas soli TaxID=1081025 RepID=A0A9X9WRP7_9PROT|nr:tripartite tricarboxylate transporter substrate binding protein [Neoroseomonas soli]MBR0669826.1 tripartite tricarboxylate transporter substrate binding protein [Neoroseomonas soli]